MSRSGPGLIPVVPPDEHASESVSGADPVELMASVERARLSARGQDPGRPVGRATLAPGPVGQERLAGLTALSDLGAAMTTTTDLGEYLDLALRAVVTHLPCDRALILLADEERGVLAGGRSVGETQQTAAVIARLELPLDDPHSELVALYRADGPVVLPEVDQGRSDDDLQPAGGLGVTALLGTPLVNAGRTVGILAIDGGPAGRRPEPGDGPLLFTIGTLIAAAVENARRYDALAAHDRELQDHVRHRTEQLASALEDAQAAHATAESASAARRAMLTDVGHELRAPLTMVVGLLGRIRRRLAETVLPAVSGADPEVGQAMRGIDADLGVVSAESERLAATIDGMLDLQADGPGWAVGPLSIREVVERATTATAVMFETTGLILTIELEPDLPPVEGDRDRLILVLVSLIANAVRSTPEGGVSVAADRVEGAVRVAVVDSGVGIEPARHDAVWESRQRRDDAPVDLPWGTDLALPTCRRIVERHGGRLWLESEVGRGSAFIFTLPLEPIAPEAPSDASETGGPGATDQGGSDGPG